MTNQRTLIAVKKRVSPLVLGAAVLLSTACLDLTETPISGITDQYYSTPTGFEAAVNATYSVTREWYGQEIGLTMTVFGTDEFTRGADGSHKHFNDYSAALNGDATFARDAWRSFFRGINAANTVIARAPDAAIPEATKAIRVGEAKFLRALYFLNAVRIYGEIPMPLEPTAGPVTEATREPAAKIYEQIIKDLTEAEAALPASQPQYGRATKGAAQHLLALTYLTRGAAGDFAKAADAGKRVIAGPYSLLAKYSDLWTLGNEVNSEIVWAVQFTADLLTTGPGNKSHLYYIMAYELEAGMVRDKENGRAFKRWRSTPWMYQNFGDRSKDSRYDDSYTQVYYSNNPTSIPKVNGVPKWNIGDTALWLSPTEISAEERAKRPYVVYTPSQYTEARFVSFNKKFIDPNRLVVNSEEGSRDWYVARLADTYLLVAEAYIRDGNAAAAVPFINAVRERAAKPGVPKAEMHITAGQATLDFLLDERSRELGGEGMRWFDLKRTGKFLERVAKYNPQAAPGIKEHHLLRPVPNEQITLTSNNFQQNPGY